MGVTTTTMSRLFQSVQPLVSGGYECGITADSVSVTLYLYPLSEKATALKSDGIFRHAKRLGGLGAGVDFSNDGSGKYQLNLTSGTHFVYFYAELMPSTAKLIQLAHLVYRALA
jgi:hypothetical protein